MQLSVSKNANDVYIYPHLLRMNVQHVDTINMLCTTLGPISSQRVTTTSTKYECEAS